MVSNFARPGRQEQPTAMQQARLDKKTANFPLSSPPTNETNYLKSDRSEKTFDRDNPFLSPNLSETSTSETESGASSEQDEFHLERYSSTLKRRKEDHITRKQSQKRYRPDLNVVTNFPSSQAKALASGVRVEAVNAKKTAAKFRPKSVVSAKAEHVYDNSVSRRARAMANVRDLAARRTDRKTREEHNESGTMPQTTAFSAASDSPVKPIVIGISVPKHEADAHERQKGHESAISLITPGTPQIVVTPAEEDGPWRKEQNSRLRVPSSIYSQVPHAPAAQTDKPGLPPVPQIPAGYALSSNMEGGNPQQPKGGPKGILIHHGSFESIAYESPAHPPYPSNEKDRRNSSESQRRILPDSAETGRPKSQGWWNLALSPMLSRAGTIKSVFNRSSPEEPKVPPLPTGRSRRLSSSTTIDSDASPDTPRRIGMASARASTWSRWTSWEKTRNQNGTNEQARGDVNTTVPPMPLDVSFGATANAAAISGRGLAAEYFHACAIEQLSSEPYFECINHSCSEKLPKLQSVYDRSATTAANPTSDKAFAVVPIPMPEPELGHQRTLSNSTRATSGPEELSPNVREANIVTMAKAKAVESPPLGPGSTEKKEDAATLRALEGVDDVSQPAVRAVPAPPRAQSARYPNIAAITPPPPVPHLGAPLVSPGPISPEAQQTMAPPGALPMREVERQPQQINYYNQYHYAQSDAPETRTMQLSSDGEQKESPRVLQKKVTKEESEKAEEKEKKPGLFSRLKQCTKVRKAANALTTPQPAKKKRIIAIAVALILMIIAAVVLATQLTRHGDGTPSQQQWLNLTGYPPMPTGISTIIRPDITKTQAGCAVQNLWSCALPKENQAEIAPNNPDQPNFRFEIKFQNGTVPSNMTVPLSKRVSNPFSENLFKPNPPPPSRADQLFMGNTTDNITGTFDGEVTPFFMTFIPAFPINPSDPAVTGNVTTKLLRRQQGANITNAIPPADVQSDGSAAPANLLPVEPLPFSQPIQLYNRGLQTEHYGFYMYYDKAIFLSADFANTNDTNPPSAQQTQQDADGGSLRTQAQARCTFSQTRFLVQIFTNPSFNAHLLGKINSTAPSAINYTPPGSFPYPTTITIDRHGGNINKKAAYCYGVDSLQVIQEDVKAVVAEDRSAGGGTLINPAPSLFEIQGQADGFDQEAGGIDGGTGGCECVWQNWN